MGLVHKTVFSDGLYCVNETIGKVCGMEKLISDVRLKGKSQSNEFYPITTFMLSSIVSNSPGMLHLRLMGQLSHLYPDSYGV